MNHLKRALMGVALFLATTLATGCGRESQVRRVVGNGPRLALVDSVMLHESDSLYLAHPWGLADGRGETYLVSDAFFDRAIRFDHRGVPVTVYGSQGDGPGQLLQATLVFQLNDSTVALADEARHQLVLFRSHQGPFERRLAYPGIIRSVQVTNEGVLFGSLNKKRGTAIARWDTSSDSFHVSVRLPTAYVTSEPLAGVFTGVLVDQWGDTVLVGIQGTNQLIVLSADKVLDTLEIPVRLRRGVPPDIVERLSHNPTNAEVFATLSALKGVHRRKDGSVLLVHEDLREQDRLITALVFVTVISADRKNACVDAEASLSPDALPLIGFAGDSVIVLDRRIVQSKALSYVKTYAVSTDSCTWVPIEHSLAHTVGSEVERATSAR